MTKDGSLAGPEGARARRRHRAVLRRRAASLASRRARREEPVRRGQRARRLRDDRRAACVPVPNPSALFLAERPVGHAGLGGALLRSKARGRCSSKCRRSSAAARSATRGGWRSGIDQNRLSLLLAVLEKRAGLEPRRRRRVRQRRRRHDGRRAGGRPERRRGGRVEPAEPARGAERRRCSARSAWPARSAASRRRALRVREAAQMGFTPLRPAAREPRPADWTLGRRRLRAGRRPNRWRSARRADRLIFRPSVLRFSFIPCADSYPGVSVMAWFVLARVLFVAAVGLLGVSCSSRSTADCAPQRGLRPGAGAADRRLRSRGCKNIVGHAHARRADRRRRRPGRGQDDRRRALLGQHGDAARRLPPQRSSCWCCRTSAW